MAAGGPQASGGYHRRVIPLLLILAGVAALVAGWLVMHRIGPGVRIGRILAATPLVPVSRAVALASSGTARYVAVEGRIDAEEPWEDDNHQPLVFQRTRLELLEGTRWTAFEDVRRTVPFEISEGLDRIAVDGSALDEGLVVVTRESEGTGADVPDRIPAGTLTTTPVRLRLEVLSAVDHARVLGVPVTDPELGPVLRPGLGHPLILTTLEPDEAMRLLAHGRQTTMRIVAALMGAGVVVIAVGVVWGVVDALV